jgi:hypothetical protein
VNPAGSASILTPPLLKISLLTEFRGATGGVNPAIRRLFGPCRA